MVELAWAEEADLRPDFVGLFRILASSLEDEHGIVPDASYVVSDAGETITYSAGGGASLADVALLTADMTSFATSVNPGMHSHFYNAGN